MGIPGDLAEGLTDEVKAAIDYWREYRGEKVRIEYVDLFPDGEALSPVKITHGVEGRVEKVMTLPPGFVLGDTVEFLHTELQSATEWPKGGSYPESKGRMFVAFDTIERMVFVNE